MTYPEITQAPAVGHQACTTHCVREQDPARAAPRRALQTGGTIMIGAIAGDIIRMGNESGNTTCGIH